MPGNRMSIRWDGTDLLQKSGDGTETYLSGAPSTAIEDASEAHALNSTFDDTEAEAALDALGGKINDIIAVLVAHKLLDLYVAP